MLKQVVATMSCVGLLILAPSMAGAQTREVTRDEVTVRGAVQAVDQTARTVTVQGEDGRAVTLDVPTTATRFNQVKVGDIVTMTYYDRVSVRAKPAGEAAVNRVLEPTTTANPGALPGATRARQRVSTMTLTAVNQATRSITFSGPKGESYSRFVAESVDPTVLANLKVGDRVDVTWTEALSLQVVSGASSSAAPPAPDSFRNRTTVSVQFGIDNQFSGKLIKASSGTTTGGQPINLNETSFDDVYGRIGLLKSVQDTGRARASKGSSTSSGPRAMPRRLPSLSAPVAPTRQSRSTSTSPLTRPGESKVAIDGTSLVPGSRPISVISSESIGTRTSGVPSWVCRPRRRPDSQLRTESSSRSPGRSPLVRRAAC